MNRREFVRGSLLSSLTGLAGGDLLLNPRPAGAEKAMLPASPPAGGRKHRVYAHLLDPREHPDYTRRHVQPPSWDTFDGRTQFTALRENSEQVLLHPLREHSSLFPLCVAFLTRLADKAYPGAERVVDLE